MRFIPLIPLVLLWLGTVLIESLAVNESNEAEQSFSAVIQDANVIGTQENLDTIFNANDLRIYSDSILANNVYGELNLSSQEFIFKANAILVDSSSGLINLNGQVYFRQNNNIMQTNQAVLTEEGELIGKNTKIFFGNSLAYADEFKYTPTGKLFLTGNVTASFKQ